MIGKTARLLAASVLLASQLLAVAQAQGIGSILGGSQLPSRIKASELPDDFRAVELKVQGASGMEEMFSGPFGIFMSLGMAGAGNAQAQSGMQILSMLGVSWTKGETTTLHGHEFLIVYKPIFDMAASMKSDFPNGMRELSLSLSYIKVDSISVVTPRPDLTKAMMAITPATVTTTPGDAKTATISNGKQMALGMIMYSSDYDDYLPYVQDTKSAYYVTYPYMKSVEAFKTLNPNGGMFRFNMAIAGVSMSEIEAPAEMPMYYESNAWPDGTRVVVFSDGHVKSVSEEEWVKMQPYLTVKLKRTTRPLPIDYGKNWPPGGGG